MTDTHSAIGVRVSAPARMHLGFLDLNGALGRRYGSIGLALDGPTTELSVRRADNTDARGPEHERVLKLVARAREAFGLEGGYAIDVHRAIPAHAGLGSGTQLAIAVGAAMMGLEGRKVSAHQLGDLAGRGARSAIGIAAFEGGGFIVDGGRGARDCPPPVLVQKPFPEDWRAILVFDRDAQGTHGDRETQAFEALPEFPDHFAGELCRLVVMQLLPGLLEEDLPAFGSALSRIQEIVGEHFASAQNGSPWTSNRVGEMVKKLAEAGATGLGQTSWGPTGFAFVSSPGAADRLYHSFREEATAKGLELLVARGRNVGARIEELSASAHEIGA